ALASRVRSLDPRIILEHAFHESHPPSGLLSFFFFNATAPTEIYTLSLHDALPISILLYHSISEPSSRYAVSPGSFARQIEFVSQRYRVVSLAEIESILRGGFDGPRHVVVTFDDAYRDFLSGALPVLTRFGVAATIFVPTRF